MDLSFQFLWNALSKKSIRTSDLNPSIVYKLSRRLLLQSVKQIASRAWIIRVDQPVTSRDPGHAISATPTVGNHQKEQASFWNRLLDFSISRKDCVLDRQVKYADLMLVRYRKNCLKNREEKSECEYSSVVE